MWILIALAALALFIWLGTRASDQAEVRRRSAQRQNAALQNAHWRAAQQARKRRAEYQRLNERSRLLQYSLLTVNQAPDFQRAASFAHHAEQVPLAFRQRIFRRFRINLVRHMRTRLEAGEDAERLLQSLTALVQGLGMASFEAQYIESEARQQMAVPSPARAVPFNQQLQGVQRAHEERVGALRTLTGVDNDTREQLVEAEEARFREAILALGQQQAEPQ